MWLSLCCKWISTIKSELYQPFICLEYLGSVNDKTRWFNARKQRKTTEWERLEISSRKLEIPREHFTQRITLLMSFSRPGPGRGQLPNFGIRSIYFQPCFLYPISLLKPWQFRISVVILEPQFSRTRYILFKCFI